MLSRDEVTACFRLVFGRDLSDDDPNIPAWTHAQDLKSLAASFVSSEEFAHRHAQAVQRVHRTVDSALFRRHTGSAYRAPSDLQVTPTALRRVLLVGQCLLDAWPAPLRQRDIPVDHFAFNNISKLPDEPPAKAEEYDFQVVSVPLRHCVPETDYLHLSYQDETAHRRLFDQATQRMRTTLHAMMHWNERHHLLTFVTNFLTPQEDLVGRLLPRNDLRNMVFFVEELNRALVAELKNYRDTYLLDVDQISATFGRKLLQDDSLLVSNHGALFTDFDAELDLNRIEVPGLPMEHYAIETQVFLEAVWSEVIAMFRTLRHTDMVKLVAIDLDDTLWRGVIGDTQDATTLEGRPLGFIEALQFLKKRGVLLAIVSKNEESRIVKVWDSILQGRLHLDEFAARRINWRPKSENLAEIIKEVNVLPRNVVFIDDNPVERAAVLAALPEVRALGAHIYYDRRILLWSSETQVASITSESASRTQMVQAQAVREAGRRALSRDEFLVSLNVRLTMSTVTAVDDPRYRRAFELINKTNQFNTTGRRWTSSEMVAALDLGLVLYIFDLEDAHTRYGLVGVLLVQDGNILQFVMSCRVLGLDAELAALAELCQTLKATGLESVSAQIVETEVNFPCRDLYSRAGWKSEGAVWRYELSAAAVFPPHIAVDVD